MGGWLCHVLALPRAGPGLCHVCWNHLSFKAKPSLSTQELGTLPGQPRPPGTSTLLRRKRLAIHPCRISLQSSCAPCLAILLCLGTLPPLSAIQAAPCTASELVGYIPPATVLSCFRPFQNTYLFLLGKGPSL